MLHQFRLGNLFYYYAKYMQNTQSTHIIIPITQKELDLKGRKNKSPFIQIIHFLCIYLYLFYLI